MKKILAALMILAAVIFAACDSITIGSKKAETPQEFLELMYQEIDNSKITFEDIYNDDFANVSKQMISAEDYIAAATAENADILTTGENITKITPTIEKECADNISKMSTILEYAIDGTPATRTCTDYVIKINGSYKYLYKGILAQKAYKMTAPDESNPVHSDIAVVYRTGSGITLELGMTNQTASNYSFGVTGGAKIDITTTEGEFTVNLPQAYALNPNGKITLTAVFDDAKGTVQKIKVNNIYTLAADGLPVETGDGIIYSLNVT